MSEEEDKNEDESKGIIEGIPENRSEDRPEDRPVFEELQNIISTTSAAIKLINFIYHSLKFELQMLHNSVFFRPTRKSVPDRDYVLAENCFPCFFAEDFL